MRRSGQNSTRLLDDLVVMHMRRTIECSTVVDRTCVYPIRLKRSRGSGGCVLPTCAAGRSAVEGIAPKTMVRIPCAPRVKTSGGDLKKTLATTRMREHHITRTLMGPF